MGPGSAVNKINAIILAAGKSERMGMPKFLLKNNENKTFLEMLSCAYTGAGCIEVVVVLNSDSLQRLEDQHLKLAPGIKLAVNRHPEWERFYSLKTGVMAMESHSAVFVSNIDNPFADSMVLQELINMAGKYDYLFPVFNGRGGHPFMISERVVREIAFETRDQVHLREFLSQYTSKAVSVKDEKVLVNINTREDYLKVFGRKVL